MISTVRKIVNTYILIFLLTLFLSLSLVFKPLVIIAGIIIFKKHIWVMKMIKEKIVSFVFYDYRILGYLGIKIMAILSIIFMGVVYVYMVELYDSLNVYSSVFQLMRPVYKLFLLLMIIHMGYRESKKSTENEMALKFILGSIVDILAIVFVVYSISNNSYQLLAVTLILFDLTINIFHFSKYWNSINIHLMKMACSGDVAITSIASDISFLCNVQGAYPIGIIGYEEIPWNFKKLVKMRIVIIKDTYNINQLYKSNIEFRISPELLEMYKTEKKTIEKNKNKN